MSSFSQDYNYSGNKAIEVYDGSLKTGIEGYFTIEYVHGEVDFDSSKPWAVRYKMQGWLKLGEATKSGETAQFWIIPDGNLKYDSNQHGASVKAGFFEDANFSSYWYGSWMQIDDIRDYVSNSSIKPHEWVNVSFKFDRRFATSWFSWGIKGDSDNAVTSKKVKLLMPKVVGGNSNNWRGNVSVGYPRYTWRNIKISGSFSGLVAGNSTHYVKLMVGKTVIATSTNGTSGNLSGYFKTNYPNTYTARVVVFDDSGNEIKTLATTNFSVSYPPPEPPTMGYVNNTTARSINTSKSKVLSANWGVSYAGYPADYLTYEYYCYSSTKDELKHGTTDSGSFSFTYSIPEQHTGMNIYWKVRVRNSTGWSNWITSENIEIFWAYTEPAKIKAGSVTPNRFQLFNGNTDIAVTANCNIGLWGDRPGARSVEYAMLRNGGTVLKWYGKNTTSETGNLPQNLTISVPETDVKNTYHVVAYKRLDNTEYTTSSDPKYPTTGDNHATMGTISFYEVIGKIRGSLSLNPSIIISGLPSEIHYDFNYDQQSSEKVSLRVEVYRITTKQVTKTINLDQNVNKSKVLSNVVTSTLVEDQQADAYEIRLKAVVTELLGNTHEYTLATLTPQVYDQPTGSLTLRELSKPIPTNNFTALVAKQATDIAWNYTYSFQGVRITKVEMVCNSSPYGNEIFNLSFDPSTSPYYSNYKRISKGDFTLGSQVKAYVIIYYQIIGFPTVYKKQTNTVTINITPTRYIYFLARVNRGEEQLNKLHPLVNGKDKTSKKIHLD